MADGPSTSMEMDAAPAPRYGDISFNYFWPNAFVFDSALCCGNW